MTVDWQSDDVTISCWPQVRWSSNEVRSVVKKSKRDRERQRERDKKQNERVKWEKENMKRN